jgi:hypothetical protein
LTGFQISPSLSQIDISTEKSEKPTKKMKKNSGSSQDPQDATALNDHYITQLNDFFAEIPTSISPAVDSLNPMYAVPESQKISGISRRNSDADLSARRSSWTSDLKQLHEQAPQRIASQNSLLQDMSQIPCAPTATTLSVEPPFMPSRGFESAPYVPSTPRQIPAGGNPYQGPLGLPFIPRGPGDTSGMFQRVAFHELSLKERLAPALSSSPTYSDDFKMNIQSGSDNELEESMFDDWMDEEDGTTEETEVSVPTIQFNYDWNPNNNTPQVNNEKKGCFSSSQLCGFGYEDENSGTLCGFQRPSYGQGMGQITSHLNQQQPHLNQQHPHLNQHQPHLNQQQPYLNQQQQQQQPHHAGYNQTSNPGFFQSLGGRICGAPTYDKSYDGRGGNQN